MTKHLLPAGISSNEQPRTVAARLHIRLRYLASAVSMLDSFCIFTKGGALLWTIQLAALRGDPVNALIRTCLLEERLGESSFSYTPPSGSAYTMKWTLHNVNMLLKFFRLWLWTLLNFWLCLQGLGLVFVAVYQRALKLLYVDELLERVKHEFAQQYKPDQVAIEGCYGSQRLIC